MNNLRWIISENSPLISDLYYSLNTLEFRNDHLPDTYIFLNYIIPYVLKVQLNGYI